MYGVGRLSPATGGHVSTTWRKGRRCRPQERTPRLGRRLRRGRQQHRGSSYKRVNGMSRFRTRLEGLDFNLDPKSLAGPSSVTFDAARQTWDELKQRGAERPDARKG